MLMSTLIKNLVSTMAEHGDINVMIASRNGDGTFNYQDVDFVVPYRPDFKVLGIVGTGKSPVRNEEELNKINRQSGFYPWT